MTNAIHTNMNGKLPIAPIADTKSLAQTYCNQSPASKVALNSTSQLTTVNSQPLNRQQLEVEFNISAPTKIEFIRK